MIAISKENMLFIRDHMLPTPIKVKLGEFFSDNNLERPDEPSIKKKGKKKSKLQVELPGCPLR